ncbi:MAG: cyclase family protein [Planctomycetota bacterium]
MSRLIDISPLVGEGIAVWPGDVPYARQVGLALEDGHNIALSSITTTLHLGAHADAPNHYVQGGEDAASRDLAPYYGPCQVVHVDLPRGARVLPEHLPGPLEAPRLLVCTRSFPDPRAWNTDFNSLSPELIEHLAARGGVLVGIDTPSVDPFDSKALETHHALARHGVANLEGLVLEHVPAGRYTLIALPLRLAGADASPVRAALVAD